MSTPGLTDKGSGAVVVTGAAGFIGRALVSHLSALGRPVRAAVRRPGAHWPAGVTEHAVGDMNARTDWRSVLQGADVVVHCAARVHQLRDESTDPLSAFRRANTDASLNLAQQALRAGLRRYVFVSSIGVNGAETTGTPFRSEDAPAPHSPYALSKLEAEIGLRALAEGSPMQWVVVRPPMVYGPGAPGNFARLLHAVHRGWPLPLGATRNRRSLVARGNLVDLLVRCADHPAAAGAVWLVSDGDDVSTTELLRRVAQALGVASRLVPVPGAALRALTDLLGRHELGQRLFGSLQIDLQPTCRNLQWRPPVAMQQELDATARAFLAVQVPT